MSSTKANTLVTKTNGWKTTTERFVAYFDIMGFKDFVLKKNHDEIVLLLKKLQESRGYLEKFNNQTGKVTKIKYGNTKSFTFSDSIIFFSEANTLADLNKILIDCMYLLREALDFQIPIKGAIAYGTITVDIENSLYFGQPIIDAYLLHEELLMYSVILDHSFEKKIKDININALNDCFAFYMTPLKSGKINHYILKPEEKEKKDNLQNLKKLYHTVSGKPRQYIDNTIEFINHVISEKSK